MASCGGERILSGRRTAWAPALIYLLALVPQRRQPLVRAAVRRAYRAASAAAARHQLQALASWLETNGHPDAAASLREGLEETLTVLKLELPPSLRRFFARHSVLPAATGETRSVMLTLTGGMMGSDVWTINGKRYPDTDPIRCRKGDCVRITLRNNSMEAHPMHLHGQSFRVLAANGIRYEQPLVKDVVDVEAHMGSAVVELVAHNSGDWLFHCHKPMHMMGGMVSVVKVG